MAYLGRDRPRRAASGVPPRPPRQPSAAERASHPLCQGGERHRAPRDPRERLGLDVAGRSARAGDARDEVTKGIVEFLDVRQHAHGRMVGTVHDGVHAAFAARGLYACCSVAKMRIAVVQNPYHNG